MVDAVQQPPSSPQLPPQPPSESPDKNRRRRLLIIGGVILAVVLLIVVVVASLLTLRSSSEGGSNQRAFTSNGSDSGGTGSSGASLPGSDDRPVGERLLNFFQNNDGGDENFEEGSSEDPFPFTSDPTDELSIDELVSDDGEPYENPQVLPEKLAVDVTYQRGAAFDLEIASVARTQSQTTIQDYSPIQGEPYSILRVLDEEGRTILAKPFGISTSVILDGIGIPTGPAPLDFNRISLVVELVGVAPPARVIVTTADGLILDEQSFTFRDLPEESIGTQSQSSSSLSLLGKIARFLGAPDAFAQEDAAFKLVVINDRGASISAGMNAAGGMVSSLEPWSDFQDQIEIVPINNSQPLSRNLTGPTGETITRGCKILSFLGNQYPLCEDDSIVRQIVQEQVPDWDLIVVVMGVPCNCGTVAAGFPRITAVGQAIGQEVLLHEIGHAIGKMADEYFGDRGVSGVNGPNCFPNQQSCESALSQFEDAGASGGICTQNCNNPSTWRPANRIMYNRYDIQEFGPIEKCIMGKQLAERIGGEYDCEGLRGDNFWGWYRGGLYEL